MKVEIMCKDFDNCTVKTLNVGDARMYRKRENQMLLPHEFFLPFVGKLNEENRWVKLAQLILWNIVEEHYAKPSSRARKVG